MNLFIHCRLRIFLCIYAIFVIKNPSIWEAHEKEQKILLKNWKRNGEGKRRWKIFWWISTELDKKEENNIKNNQNAFYRFDFSFLYIFYMFILKCYTLRYSLEYQSNIFKKFSSWKFIKNLRSIHKYIFHHFLSEIFLHFLWFIESLLDEIAS